MQGLDSLISGSNFLRFLERSPDPMLVQQGGVVQFVNAAFVAVMRGKSAESFAGRKLFSLIAPIDFERMTKRFAEGNADATAPASDVRCVRDDGSIAVLEFAATRLSIQAPDGFASMIVFREVTSQRAQAGALQLAEEQFRAVFANAPIGMGVIALDGKWIFNKVNPALAKMLGYGESELTGRSAMIMSEPGDPDAEIDRRVVEQAEPGDQLQTITRVRTKSGARLEVERYLSVIGDAGGKPVSVLVQLIDVTARRAIEKALHDSEGMYRALVRNLPNLAVLLFDHQLRYTLVDGDRVLEGVGLKAEQLLGKYAPDMTKPETRKQVESAYRRALAGDSMRWEHTRDGNIYDMHTNPMRDDSGAIVGGMALLYETTGHWELQQKLQESEARLGSLIESTGDSMWSIDREGKLTLFNRKFAQDMRRTQKVELVIGMNMFDFLPEPQRTGALENHQRVLNGESVSFEWTDWHDGKAQHLLVSHSPIISGGQISGAALTAKDITARRTMELASERQKAVVELLQAIAGVANESTTSDNAIAHSLALVAEFTGWSVGHAFKLVDGVLVSRKTWYERDLARYAKFRAETEKLRFTPGMGLPGRVLESRKPSSMSTLRNVIALPRDETAQKLGLVNGFAFPVFDGDEVNTVVEFFSERDEETSEEIVQLMSNVAIQLGRVIERERHAQQVSALSLTDELTGLHNRRGFMALGAQVMRSAARSKRPSTVLFADLDGLKLINDKLGHEAGDAAIQTFARLLRRSFRDNDIVSRFGGDEFVILLEAPRATVVAAQERLLNNLEQHNQSHPEGPRLAVSMGLVEMEPDRAESLEALVARADALMYENKKARKDAALHALYS